MMKHPRHLLLPALLLSLFSVCVQAQDQDNGLKQRMSSSEFAAAGLSKLTPDELANLNQWLGSHEKVKTKMVSSSGKPVFYADKDKREKVRAHIKGPFSGWHGNDTFTLDNGQVWQQIGTDQPSCSSSNNPKVKVKPSLFGNWLMVVDGCNNSVHVKRVR